MSNLPARYSTVKKIENYILSPEVLLLKEEVVES